MSPLTFLLDSSIIIDVLNQKHGRFELIQQLLCQGVGLASCPITIAEVYAGLRTGKEKKTERFLRSLTFFPVTWEISKMAGDLICAWKPKGRTFTLPDMTIATVAISHGLLLVTSNEKHFPMPELQIYPLS